MSKASDADLLEYARHRNLVVVTLDADFHMLLAASGAVSPSVIRIRRQSLSGQQVAAITMTVLDRSRQALEAGAVVSVTNTLIRVKLLLLPQSRPRPAFS